MGRGARSSPLSIVHNLGFPGGGRGGLYRALFRLTGRSRLRDVARGRTERASPMRAKGDGVATELSK